MKKMWTVFMAAALVFTAVPAVQAAEMDKTISTAPESGMTVKASASASEAAEAAKLLEDIKGTYQQLFNGGIFNDEFHQYWVDDCAAVVGASGAENAARMMKAVVGSTKYGADAQEGAFCCDFINGVKNLTFNGESITVTRTDNTTETHIYEFVRTDKIGGVMPGYIFQSKDNNEDEFKYFFLCGDTPGTTYHLELRYGSDLDELLKYDSGKYANWMAAAFPVGAMAEKNQASIQNVIALFCTENLADATTAETNKQRAAIAGTWDADLSGIAGYEKAKMYCVLGENGTGVTYVDANGTGSYTKASSYTFYAYDNDGKDSTNSGVYIPVNEAAGTTEAGAYALTQKDGKTILTFTTLDGGKISYVKREAAAPATPSKKVTSIKDSKGNANYKIQTDGTAQYTGLIKGAKNIVIPDTVKDSNGKSYKVTAIAANALKSKKKVTKITIGKNVTTIGSKAFSSCSKLKSITIKSTKLKEAKISKTAFSGVTKKTTVTVAKAKVKSYTKLLQKKGLGKKVTVKS